MIKCFEVILEGRVQGVGFRNFALSKAVKYNIKGFVRNTGDRNLEIVCCGENEDLEKFISEIKKGPSFAFINKVKIREYPGTEDFSVFKITY